MNDGKTTQGVSGSLLELKKSGVGRLSDEDVDAYIEKVMRELLYPFFLRRKIREKLRGFLCSEFGLDAALSEMPADQLSFWIGNPRDVAQDFAVTCRYAWLRGKMPAWQKWLIVAALVVLIALAALLAVHVVWQLSYDHGWWGDKAISARVYDLSDDSDSNAQFY